MMGKCVNELDKKLSIWILRILLIYTVMTHNTTKKEKKKKKKKKKKLHLKILNLKLLRSANSFHANPYFIQNL
jgi:hypothetical protein